MNAGHVDDGAFGGGEMGHREMCQHDGSLEVRVEHAGVDAQVLISARGPRRPRLRERLHRVGPRNPRVVHLQTMNTANSGVHLQTDAVSE